MAGAALPLLAIGYWLLRSTKRLVTITSNEKASAVVVARRMEHIKDDAGSKGARGMALVGAI